MKNPHQPTRQLEIAQRRQRVMRLFLQGNTAPDIAEKEDIDVATACRDLRVIHDEWLARTHVKHDEYIARELALLDEIERQAWEAWNRSLSSQETTQAEKSTRDEKTKLVRKSQTGNSMYLRIIFHCIEKRCKLLKQATRAADRPSDVITVEAMDAQIPPPRLPEPLPLAPPILCDEGRPGTAIETEPGATTTPANRGNPT